MKNKIKLTTNLVIDIAFYLGYLVLFGSLINDYFNPYSGEYSPDEQIGIILFVIPGIIVLYLVFRIIYLSFNSL